MNSVVSTRVRLVHNAVEIASTSRELSHNDVTLEMMASFDKRAVELADRWATATAGDIAGQLLKEQTRTVRRRSPNRRQGSGVVQGSTDKQNRTDPIAGQRR